MCGRYYRLGDKQALAEQFRALPVDEGEFAYAPAYNVVPSTLQPVIRQSRESAAREIVPMRWGLVGHNSAGPTPNAPPSTHVVRPSRKARSGVFPSCAAAVLVPLSGSLHQTSRIVR